MVLDIIIVGLAIISGFLGVKKGMVAIITKIINAKDNAFQMPLSNNIIANIQKVALNPYKIKTACFCVKPFLNIL